MTPIDQTMFGDPDGNCLMACVASILDLSLDACPDLTDAKRAGAGYWDVLQRFVNGRGLVVAYIGAPSAAPAGLAIAGGNGPRDLPHCVVVKDGILVHDPHPSRAGIAELTWFIVLLLAVRCAPPGVSS